MKREELLGTESLAKKMSQIKATMDVEKPKSKKGPTVEAQPKLFISGKLDRKKNTYVLRSLALLDTVNNDIQKYCRGGENAILNYLIKEGLEKIKKSPTMISVDASSIEETDTEK